MTKLKGKVIDYNGYNGYLIDKDKVKYTFTVDDLFSKDIKVNDIEKILNYSNIQKISRCTSCI